MEQLFAIIAVLFPQVLDMLLPVVLAGGIGSRLWPVSRALLPKQFIHLPQYEGSLFQNTLRHLDGISDIGEPLVVCNTDHRFLVAGQLRQLGKVQSTILLEPVGRNTAPAVAMAALTAMQHDRQAILLVLPADHVIQIKQVLHRAIARGIELALDNKLVTFGIVPSAPETGYGYIERGEALDAGDFRVARFVEKPDQVTAQDYVASGNYYWNSGMFMFSASNFLEELAQHAPDILASCQAAHEAMTVDPDFLRIPARQFGECRSDSIDYAVMENTDQAAVIPLDAGWNDLGAWNALWDIEDKDDSGNAVTGDVLTEDVQDSYIQAQSRLVAAVGVEDTVIVETSDAVLVANKDKVQNVKKILEKLEAADRKERISHNLVYRPWGSYESLACGNGYQVKHIVVHPGESLSLQLHHRRAEHWTVIKGTGLVTCDDQEISLGKNESIFIPLGSRHRLANPGTEPVEIIEVQVGDYLGEDDIVRFEDKYGRIEAAE